jgi:hypothetical protein
MNIQTTTIKDEKLWNTAKERVEFKKHLLIYFLVNAFLWALWYFTGAENHGFLPWPAYASIGWGIGVFFNYMSAYSSINENMMENEYQKLINKQG